MEANEKKVKRGLISDPSVPVPRLQRMPKRKQMVDCNEKYPKRHRSRPKTHTLHWFVCVLLTLQECRHHHLHVGRNIAISLCENDVGEDFLTGVLSDCVKTLETPAPKDAIPHRNKSLSIVSGIFALSLLNSRHCVFSGYFAAALCFC